MEEDEDPRSAAAPSPLGREGKDLLRHVRALGLLRAACPLMEDGTYRTAHVAADVFAFSRGAKRQAAHLRRQPFGGRRRAAAPQDGISGTCRPGLQNLWRGQVDGACHARGGKRRQRALNAAAAAC